VSSGEQSDAIDRLFDPANVLLFGFQSLYRSRLLHNPSFSPSTRRCFNIPCCLHCRSPRRRYRQRRAPAVNMFGLKFSDPEHSWKVRPSTWFRKLGGPYQSAFGGPYQADCGNWGVRTRPIWASTAYSSLESANRLSINSTFFILKHLF
jgi:hypothetical protein